MKVPNNIAGNRMRDTRHIGNVNADASRPSVEKIAPPVDVHREGTCMIVRVEIPGVSSREDFDVILEDRVLILQGRKRKKTLIPCSPAECEYGEFERRIPIPGAAFPEDVFAEYKNGILEIRVVL